MARPLGGGCHAAVGAYAHRSAEGWSLHPCGVIPTRLAVLSVTCSSPSLDQMDGFIDAFANAAESLEVSSRGMAAVSQRVLVSRQLEDAEPLTQALVRGGYEPLVIPAIQIVLRGVCPATRAALLSAGVRLLSRSAAKSCVSSSPRHVDRRSGRGQRSQARLGGYPRRRLIRADLPAASMREPLVRP